MMKKLSALIIGLFCFYTSFSQFTDTTEHYISYASTGVINRTNQSSSYVLTNALRFSIRKKSISLNNSANWIYGQQQDNLTNNDFTNTLDFNRYITKKFYYWGLGNFDKSYSLKINSRLQSGLGLAYSFVDTTNAFINLSDGLLYESSDINRNDTTREIYNTFRNSFRLRFRFASKNELVVLDGVSFLQNSLSVKEDYIIRSLTNLSFRLRKWLSLTTSATFNKVNRTNRENLLITYGLRAEKYF